MKRSGSIENGAIIVIYECKILDVFHYDKWVYYDVANFAIDWS